MRLTLTEKLKNLEFYAIAASKYLNNTLKPSTIKEYSKEIKEVLITLEIIKEHRLDIDWFLQFVRQDIDYKYYVYCVEQGDNKFAQRFLLSEEEYELLKEILL